jgi:triacylglycerol lipase
MVIHTRMSPRTKPSDSSARPGFALPFLVAGREAMAFARQAWLLRHDLVAPVIPANVGDDDDVVVFLHGLFASAGVLRPMRAQIMRHVGTHAAALSYAPGPGVDEIAGRLTVLLRDLPRTTRIHLVGHSLGGIVARHYALETMDARVVQTISLSSPFAGVPRAAWLGFEGARDLDPQSPLLLRLRLRSGTHGVPHLSIIAGADSLVKSPIAHALPGGDVIVMKDRGHNTLLFDDEVARVVEQRILDARRARRRDSGVVAAE